MRIHRLVHGYNLEVCVPAHVGETMEQGEIRMQVKQKCPICRSDRGFMELHGSTTCINCKNKIASCCGDGLCTL